MIIDSFDTKKDVLVIAEVGNNHEGSYALAEELIGLAAKAGAGAVKFQTIIPEKLVTPKNKARIEQLNKFRLTYKEFEQLSKVAKKEKVLFLSTPFDIESAAFLNTIVPAFKIASGDNNFYPLIEYISSTGKPILMSSGLADMNQLRETTNFIRRIWEKRRIKQDLAILHCVAKYPVALTEANLLSIENLKKLNVTVGYSDHTIGVEAAIISVALGARIIEKHFTIDKNYSDFCDHKLSADPKEFTLLTSRIKETIEMLGSGNISNQEKKHALTSNIRRSIVANHDLKKGTTISLKDITWLRPGGGLPPGSEGKILNKVLNKSLKRGDMIFSGDVLQNGKK